MRDKAPIHKADGVASQVPSRRTEVRAFRPRKGNGANHSIVKESPVHSLRRRAEAVLGLQSNVVTRVSVVAKVQNSELQSVALTGKVKPQRPVHRNMAFATVRNRATQMQDSDQGVQVSKGAARAQAMRGPATRITVQVLRKRRDKVQVQLVKRRRLRRNAQRRVRRSEASVSRQRASGRTLSIGGRAYESPHVRVSPVSAESGEVRASNKVNRNIIITILSLLAGRAP